MNRMDELQNVWSDEFVSSKGRAVLNLAPRVGKIRTTILILNKMGMRGKILISYPDNKIKDSWVNDFNKWGYSNPNIVFSNTSSLEKHINQKWDMYIIDECHELSQKQEELAYKICKNSEYVLGLSGTINKSSEEVLKGMGLKILTKYPIEEAIKDRIISEYQIYIHSIPLDTRIKKKNSKGALLSEKQVYDRYTYVINQKMRSGEPVDFLLFRRKNLLSNSIAKKKKTLELLEELKGKRLIVFTGLKKVAEGLNIPFYHSTSDEGSFTDFVEENISHLAMVNIGGVGVTYRNMDAIIMSNFTHNDEATEQTLARSMVMDYKEKVAQIHIITSNEPEELEKLRRTLKNFDKTKIKYV